MKVRVDTPGYRLDDASRDGRIGNDDVPDIAASHTVTVEAPDNDPRGRGVENVGNRRLDTVTLRAFSASRATSRSRTP